MKVVLFWLFHWWREVLRPLNSLFFIDSGRLRYFVLSIMNFFIVVMLFVSLLGSKVYAYNPLDVIFLVDHVCSSEVFKEEEYPITNTIGQRTKDAPIKIDKCVSSDDVQQILSSEASKRGGDIRIQGFSEHDDEMKQYLETSKPKRKSLLTGYSLNQYRGYHNSVARIAAFASSLVYEDKLRIETELRDNGFELIKYVDDSQDNQFFLASMIVDGKKKYFISIRGTASWSDALRDANVIRIEFPMVTGKVHKGFGTLAQAVYNTEEVKKALEEIKNNKADLLITGHSLGGAAANILTIMLQESKVPLDNMQTYTFGAPPVGDTEFFNKYNQQGKVFRILHQEDPVAYSAYFAAYKHIGENHIFTLIGSLSSPKTCGYISTAVSNSLHVSLQDIEQNIAVGIISLKSGGEETLVAISKLIVTDGEIVYRLTTLSGSTFVKIVNGQLIPIKGDVLVKAIVSLPPSVQINVNINIYPNKDFQRNLDQLIRDINRLSVDSNLKINDVFDASIEAAKSLKDGVVSEIVILGEVEYKLVKSGAIVANMASYHLALFGAWFGGFDLGYSHAHGMDGTYFNTITCFETNDTYIGMVAQNELVGSTKIVSNIPVSLLDDAMLVSESPLDDVALTGNSAFKKVWTLKNTGTSTWNSNYRLRYIKGNGLSVDHSEIRIKGTVSPGNSYTFEVPMQLSSPETEQKTLTDIWEFINPSGIPVKVSNSPVIWARIKVSPMTNKCPADLLEESFSGFTSPLPYNFSNNGGYQFKQKALYGNYVYHPGEDWNVPQTPGGAGDGDQGLDVVAVADGKVVSVASDNWGGGCYST